MSIIDVRGRDKNTAMATIRLDDRAEIAYRTVGEGNTTLPCMHGWAGSGA
jgi:hypothetical protein